MGFRAAIVVCTTSFLLGVVFTHWIADSLTLWKQPVTDEHLWAAASYYSVIAKTPVEMLYFLGSVTTIGGVTILWSLGDGQAGNLMFDGASIFLFGVAVSVYMYSVLPDFSKFIDITTPQKTDIFPPQLRLETLGLASNNLICSVALTGVLLLQGGRLWAERSDAADAEEEEASKLVGNQSSSSAVQSDAET